MRRRAPGDFRATRAVLTVTCCEKTYCKAAPHTVYAVYRECADRIIYFKLDINKFNCYYDEDT